MKKKITIFSSTGGGGHLSASNALKDYLQNDYIVNVVYPYEEILYPLDFTRMLTFNRYDGEKLYNIFAQKHLFSIINALYYIGKYYVKLRKKSIEKLLNDFIQKDQPDLIISVIPVINGQVLAVAKKRSIPFLVIPTDLDATTFIHGINNPDYEKFHMGLSLELSQILKTLEPANINAEYYSYIGFPLRPEFFKQHDIVTVKKELNIPQNIPVILFMLGSTGSDSFINFLHNMKNIESSCHIIVCLGRSETLKNTLENIQFPQHISITILGFTKRIPELMSIADLFVTKSGTVSVCEAIYMNLPLLLDGTSTVLNWEQFNHMLIQEQGFGDILNNENEIAQKIDSILKNPSKLVLYRKNLKNFEKKPFNKHIHILVRYLMSGKAVQNVLKFMYDFL